MFSRRPCRGVHVPVPRRRRCPTRAVAAQVSAEMANGELRLMHQNRTFHLVGEKITFQQVDEVDRAEDISFTTGRGLPAWFSLTLRAGSLFNEPEEVIAIEARGTESE